MSEVSENIKKLLAAIPEKPGSYQYYDGKGKIIYVGKAKNMKKRVSQYFFKEQQSDKTRILVRQIRDIKYIIVDTEEEALLLENSLIKQYRPKYNVLLKDDKTYPSIVIKNEYFPRIFQTRNIIKDGSWYFGPYANVYTAKLLLQLIREIYPLRSCKLSLTPESIIEKRYKVCLEYHIKRCKAPCIGLESKDEYEEKINDIKEILKGNISQVSKLLYDKMEREAKNLRFEEAEEYKKKYMAIENYRAKSTVVTPSVTNVDVFSIEDDEQEGYINYMHVGNGAIIQSYSFEYRKKLDETKEELMELGILAMRERFKSTAKEVIVPFEMESVSNDIEFTVPQRGDKKKLLELSEMNVKQYKIDKMKQAEKMNPEQRNTRLLKEIQEALKLSTLPKRIELFDNSNISGSNAVAGCVVFMMGKPSKKDYRKYQIKTVVGADDYASMAEVVSRRYRKMIEEKETLPDLILTDGGKGQMNVVHEIVEEELGLKIPIGGLSKDNRHKTAELLYGFPPETVGMKIGSPLFNLLARMQDEVHRFAISYHKEKRSKGQTLSELDGIKGIGDKTKVVLLQRYKSIKRIREADETELKGLIGVAKTNILKEWWKKSE